MSSVENGGDYREPSADGELDAAVETRRFVVDPGASGQRLDKLLVMHAGEFSRSHLQGLIERDCARVDGEPARAASQRLRAGQVVEIELQPTDESRAFRPEPIALAIVHEDEHLLVIDKPAGLVVHPAPGHWSGTLVNALLAHHAGASALPRAGIVHRLDKDTSGLMAVAKSLPAMTALVQAIAVRELRREYIAIVHGAMRPGVVQIDAPIGRDPVSRVRMAVTRAGRPARTDVARMVGDGRFTALACRLHTGRTHQIRVHLASRGHPIVADTLYGGAPALGLSRQALHAFRLGLRHPATGALLAFEAALPADLQSAWQQLVASGASARLE